MEYEESGLPNDRYVKRMFIIARYLHKVSHNLVEDESYDLDEALNKEFRSAIVEPALMLEEDGTSISSITKAALLVYPFYCANPDVADVWLDPIQDRLRRITKVRDAIKAFAPKEHIPKAEFETVKAELQLTAEDLTVVKVHALQQLKMVEMFADDPNVPKERLETLIDLSYRLINCASLLCVEEHGGRESNLNGAILETYHNIQGAFQDRGWQPPEHGSEGFDFTAD